MYFIPLMPTTKPTRFAAIIMRILPTAPMAHTCLYHQRFSFWKMRQSVDSDTYVEQTKKTDLVAAQEPSRPQLWQNEQHDEPAPRKETKRQVMPQSDERKHHNAVKNDPLASAQGNVNVSTQPNALERCAFWTPKQRITPRYPQIITPVPASPEPKSRVIICHTSQHIFWRI